MMIKQHGSVLLVTMVMLVVMTLVGLAGIEVTGLEEKMVLNMRDRQAAFEAAEVALKQAEDYVCQNLTDGHIKGEEDSAGKGGYYDVRLADSCNDMDEDKSSDDNSENKNTESSSANAASVSEKDWDTSCKYDGASVLTAEQKKAYERLVEAPSFIVERLLEDNPDKSLESGKAVRTGDMPVYHRITVQAKGLTMNTEVRLQTVFKAQNKSYSVSECQTLIYKQ